MTDISRQTILITGGCGYIGSQLIRDLGSDPRYADVHIRILDNMQGKNYRALMQLPPTASYQFIEGDILDPATVRLALEGVDTIVHLAAIVGTPMGFDKPSWIVQVNQWGTAQLVNAAASSGVKHIVFGSTTSVYGPGGPFDEKSPCRPFGPYAQSKLLAEKAILASQKSGITTTILRFGSVYGLAPVIRFDAMANRFAYLAGIGRSITIFGSGQQARSFVHVADASQSILCTLNLHTNRLYNVVSEVRSVAEIAEILSEQLGTTIRYGDQDVRTHYSFSAESNAIKELNWQPRHTLSNSLITLSKQFSSPAF